MAVAPRGSAVSSNELAGVKKAAIYAAYHEAYVNSSQLYGNLKNAKSSLAANGKIYGGIVSHHFFIAPKIAEFFAGLKDQLIETIVIVGPNHFGTGEGNIQISEIPYNTPWGVLEPDTKIIESLLKKNFITNEEIPFEKEHSISALVGFIKYYLPKAKIAPIILKRNTSSREAEQLARSLNDILPEKAVVVASVDFSHHLSSVAADFHDEVSVSAIKSFDYNRLYNLEIDSPASVDVLLRYLESRDSQKMIYENINSAGFSNNPGLKDVTSYAFAYFSKGTAEKENKISLLNFGDAMFDRDVEKNIQKGKNPFEKIIGTEGNFFKGTDFVSINLEGPITDSGNSQAKPINFKFSPEIAKLLSENKINLTNLANNHIYDCYEKGKSDTQKYLNALNISYFGDNKAENSYIIKIIGDIKIAFIGIDDTLKNSDLKSFYSLTENLKKTNDFVIVSIHWGKEYAKKPSESQIGLAHNLVDNGADIIIGHHPHVVQPMEVYKNKIIFYSLGNFIFDQFMEETRKGAGVGVVLSKNRFDFYIFPYKISGNQPELLPYQAMKEFCDGFLGEYKTSMPCYFGK